MNGEEAHRRKFDENIEIELKMPADGQTVDAFNRIVSELKSEGEHYSLNRESFIKFFNDLTESQQKEMLAIVSAEAGGKNVYDIAQEYNLGIIRRRP